MSVSLHYDDHAIRRLAERIDALAGVDTRALFDRLGAEGESQTRRRIATEKTGPGGERWQPWSPEYARTRHGGQSLLQAEGDLLDSQTYLVYVDGRGVEWGSNLIYAATHQFGDEERGIPRREYLGISTENADDLEAICDDWIQDRIRRLQ